jgi:hypothetical protein
VTAIFDERLGSELFFIMEFLILILNLQSTNCRHGMFGITFERC